MKLQPTLVTCGFLVAFGFPATMLLMSRPAASSAATGTAGAPEAPAVQPAAQSPAPPRPPATPPPAPVRAQIAKAIDQAPVHDAAGLPAYLDSLEARARSQGRVTALEVEPGMDMIRRYSDDPEQIAQFGQRMLRLQRELAGTL